MWHCLYFVYGASNNSDAPLGKTADGDCSVIGYYQCAKSK